jgi:hypothetical protein
MSRHARSVDRPTRVTGLLTVIVVWAAGLAAGFYALLGVAARYGCSSSHHGLGCGNGGTAVGVVLVLAVIATVSTVTVLAHGRTPARVLAIGVCGLAVLVACYFGTHALLDTV